MKPEISDFEILKIQNLPMSIIMYWRVTLPHKHDPIPHEIHNPIQHTK